MTNYRKTRIWWIDFGIMVVFETSVCSNDINKTEPVCQVAYLFYSNLVTSSSTEAFLDDLDFQQIYYFVFWCPRNQENFIFPHFAGFGLLRHLPTRCVYFCLFICIFTGKGKLQLAVSCITQIGWGENSINLLHILYLLWGITFIHSLLTDDLLVLFVACVVLLFIMSLSISFCY